jgi:hypothetical protein
MMDSVHFPISTDTLQAALPHRKPMVWIRNVVSAEETTGICQVLLKPGSYEFSEDGLRQSTLLEWMAQGFGFANFCYTRVTPKLAFLAQAQNIQYCAPEVWLEFKQAAARGTEAWVSGKITRTLGPISLVEAEVFWNRPEKIILASGQMKLFKGEST